MIGTLEQLSRELTDERADACSELRELLWTGARNVYAELEHMKTCLSCVYFNKAIVLVYSMDDRGKARR